MMDVKKHFLGWDTSALDSAVDFLLKKFSGDNGHDFSNLLIVVPSADGGKKLLQRLTLALDKTSWQPPDIITPGHIPERLCKPKTPVANSLESKLARIAALKQIDTDILCKLIPDAFKEDDWQSWWSLGEQLEKLTTELTSCGFSAVKLYEKCTSDFLAVENQLRYKALAEIEKLYLNILKKQNLCDKQFVQLEELKNSTYQYEGSIILLAALDLSWSVQKLLEKSNANITALINAPDFHKDGFNELGVLKPSYWRNQKLDIDDKNIHIVDRQTQQAQFVATSAKAGLNNTNNLNAVTVAMANEDARASLEREFSFVGISSRYSGGIALRQSRPFYFLEYLSNFASSNKPKLNDVADMLRHIDIENYLGFNSINLLDSYSNDHLQNYLSPACLSDNSKYERIKEVYKKLCELLPEDFQEKKPWGYWSQSITDSLDKVYGDMSLDSSKENDYKLINSLQEISKALLEQQEISAHTSKTAPTPTNKNLAIPKITFSKAIDLTLRRLSDKTTPQFPNVGIALAGVLELALDDAPVIYITGMNESNIPASINSDPFLPSEIRNKLDINDNNRRYARDFVLLSSAIKNREYVSLVVPRFSLQNEPLAPSRLFFACSQKKIVERIQKFYDDKFSLSQSHKDIFSQTLLLDDESSKFLFPKPQDDFKLDSISVTAFRDYLSCPYRFYLTHILNLNYVEENIEINKAEFGNIIHKVLQNFGTSNIKDEDNEKKIYKYLEDELNKIFTNKFGINLRPAVKVQFEQIKLRLKSFATKQVKLVKQGWTITRHTEEKLEVDIDVDNKPITLKGRIDRIDKHKNGAYRIIDYKTSDSAKTPETVHRHTVDGEKQWKDLQLPLYMDLIKAGTIEGIDNKGDDNVKLAYFNISKKDEDTKIEEAKWDVSEIEEAKKVRDSVIKKIRKAKFWPPKTPPTYDDGLQRICMDDVINRQEVIEESGVNVY